MFIEMKVFGLALDENTKNPLIILKDEEEKYVLPIWIGALEAMAISIPLNEVKTPRPLTHDLCLQVIREMGGKLEEVQIMDIKDSTYFARLMISHNHQILSIDSRPSDAIALALREKVKIMVKKELLLEADKLFPREGEEILTDSESKKWSEILEKYDAHLTKYKM
ncbi:MAG: bifunctional nuclease family protein [Desulfonauticus sp.]|nr:bifunctional nuclease family protein [Desulfonauticus sp.]